MQALTSPVFRSIALGGLLLAATAAMVKPPHMHRLVLHAPVHCGEYYLTAWRHGPVRVPAGDEGDTLTFRTRAELNDGCRWDSTETLVPIDAKRYAYSYEDHLVSCPPGAPSLYVPTPRTGYVDVLD
jgi:hypothetical protein